MNDHVQAADIIAVMLIAGYFLLTAMGIQQELMPAILIIIGYYFGHAAGKNEI